MATKKAPKTIEEYKIKTHEPIKYCGKHIQAGVTMVVPAAFKKLHAGKISVLETIKRKVEPKAKKPAPKPEPKDGDE